MSGSPAATAPFVVGPSPALTLFAFLPLLLLAVVVVVVAGGAPLLLLLPPLGLEPPAATTLTVTPLSAVPGGGGGGGASPKPLGVAATLPLLAAAAFFLADALLGLLLLLLLKVALLAPAGCWSLFGGCFDVPSLSSPPAPAAAAAALGGRPLLRGVVGMPGGAGAAAAATLGPGAPAALVAVGLGVSTLLLVLALLLGGCSLSPAAVVRLPRLAATAMSRGVLLPVVLKGTWVLLLLWQLLRRSVRRAAQQVPWRWCKLLACSSRGWGPLPSCVLKEPAAGAEAPLEAPAGCREVMNTVVRPLHDTVRDGVKYVRPGPQDRV
jgi:hypothetical protein